MCFLPFPELFKYAVVQCFFSFQVLNWVVFISADTADLRNVWELRFFWINHVWLLFPPLYYSLSGLVSSLPSTRTWSNVLSSYVSWLLISSSVFGLFYFVFVVPASLYSKLNLKYMLSPPPVSPWGQDYRLWSQAAIFSAFAFSRAAMCAAERLGEIIIKGGKRPGGSKEESDKTKRGKEKSRKEQ